MRRGYSHIFALPVTEAKETRCTIARIGEGSGSAKSLDSHTAWRYRRPTIILLRDGTKRQGVKTDLFTLARMTTELQSVRTASNDKPEAGQPEIRARVSFELGWWEGRRTRT